MKITPENMKKQYENLWNTFCKKNHDYGSSFEQSLDKHGLIAGVVRMEDKMNRISTLVDGHKHAEIASESLADTLRDLSNYSAMAACWLDGPDDVYNEENLQKIENHLFGVDAEYARNFAKMTTIMRNSHYGVNPHSDGGLKVFHEKGEDDSNDEYKLSNFEGHQEKVNEREYYTGVLSDNTIIKNWGLVGYGQSIRSRTTGQYLVEDDNPELFHKILNVLKNQNNLSIKQWSDVLCNDTKETLLTDPKGLENGYFLRQHTNPGNSERYTLAFNPEGTVKTQTGEELPYVIECFGNDYDGMTNWAIHVFESREDMVSALNYDLKVCNEHRSSTFGDSIGSLGITKGVFKPEDAKPVADAWSNFLGPSFVKNMTTDNILNKSYYGVKNGVKTFGPLFISEKTGALVVKGLLRERTNGKIHNIIWFSDTKEVLLELNGMVPKFNSYGIIYEIDSEHIKNGENYEFNPLYQDMEDKILSKFHSWDGSELKNLVFFNEDEGLESGNLTSKNGKLQIDFEDSEAYWGDKS